MGTRCFMVEEIDRDGPAHHWRRLDTGEVFGHRPVGSMWWADMTEKRKPHGPDDWHPDVDLDSVRMTFAQHPDLYPGASEHDPTLPKCQQSYLFEDGPQLCVQTPGGSWVIDSRASNCGSPYDFEHRCWIRHGEPPDITVDKQGQTCTAGAGSIQCGDYHGFLVAGELT